MSAVARYLPDLLLAIGGTLVLILGALRQDDKMRDFLRWVSLLFIAASAIALAATRSPGASSAAFETSLWLVGMPLKVGFGLAFLALFGWVMVAARAPEDSAGEWFALLQFAALGSIVLARTGNLAGIFLGVETLSLALYVLISFYYRRGAALRAGAMYLVLAGFASAFLAFGMALIYAAYGRIEISAIQQIVAAADGKVTPLATIGFALFMVGVGFKLAVVPFHMWAAEVYEAASGPVAGIIASASKGAVIASLIPFAFMMPVLGGVIVALSAASMIGGNLLGLRERRVKRVLAYSSIAHVGYTLLGFLGGEPGLKPLLFYVVAYGLSVLGAFIVLSLLDRDREPYLEDLRGMGRRHPLLAFCMTVFVASLAGLPPTVGFWGKIFLFTAAFRADHVILGVVGLIGSAIGIYYYIRILVFMYMAPEEAAAPRLVSTPLQDRALIFAAAAVIVLGVFPDAVYMLLRP